MLLNLQIKKAFQSSLLWKALKSDFFAFSGQLHPSVNNYDNSDVYLNLHFYCP
jgi:hypothetical protein